jgi:hypothetical protein
MRELKHYSGVGNNTRIAVIQDGKQIGWIERHGNSGFILHGYYGIRAGFAKTLADAKRLAMDAIFPSLPRAYEMKCEETYKRRLQSLERIFADDVYRLARAIVGGSNSAKLDMEKLLMAMAAAANRRHRVMGTEEFHEDVAGKNVHVSDLITYPEPLHEREALPL